MRRTILLVAVTGWLALIIAIGTNINVQAAAKTKVAATPPMGWNSWNHFGDQVTEADVRSAADALVSSGMRDAGYVYVNIDDGWQGKRDASGQIHPNSHFGDMKALADYVHSKGLKFGIYSSPGPQTCAGYEGSLGHEMQDAQTYAEWGVDYLKYDLCTLGATIGTYGPKAKEIPYQQTVQMMRAAYETMHKAILASGRPMVLSFCQYGFGSSWKWAASDGANLWRTTGDIRDDYRTMMNIGLSQNGLEGYAGPGHWNDPDMLEVGNGHMAHNEYVSHMSLWAILAAPLLAGNDLTTMSEDTRSILTNSEVITIDQDPAGIQGHRIWAEGTAEIWAKRLADGSTAVGLFNQGDWTALIPFDPRLIGYQGNLALRDLWLHKNLEPRSGEFETMVPIHGVVLLRIRSLGH